MTELLQQGSKLASQIFDTEGLNTFNKSNCEPVKAFMNGVQGSMIMFEKSNEIIKEMSNLNNSVNNPKLEEFMFKYHDDTKGVHSMKIIYEYSSTLKFNVNIRNEWKAKCQKLGFSFEGVTLGFTGSSKSQNEQFIGVLFANQVILPVQICQICGKRKAMDFQDASTMIAFHSRSEMYELIKESTKN
jgi:hypothetical protein